MMECNCLLVVRAKRPCKEYHYSPWMGASASQVSPQTARFLQQIPPPPNLYTPGETEAFSECLAQEHNTVTQVSA